MPEKDHQVMYRAGQAYEAMKRCFRLCPTRWTRSRRRTTGRPGVAGNRSYGISHAATEGCSEMATGYTFAIQAAIKQRQAEIKALKNLKGRLDHLSFREALEGQPCFAVTSINRAATLSLSTLSLYGKGSWDLFVRFPGDILGYDLQYLSSQALARKQFGEFTIQTECELPEHLVVEKMPVPSCFRRDTEFRIRSVESVLRE